MQNIKIINTVLRLFKRGYNASKKLIQSFLYSSMASFIPHELIVKSSIHNVSESDYASIGKKGKVVFSVSCDSYKILGCEFYFRFLFFKVLIDW
jgi:hypothetical protein